MEGGDAIEREIEGRELLGGAFGFRRGDLLAGDGDAGRLKVDAVEALGIVDKRRVAAGDDVLDDAAHCVVDILRRLALHSEQRRETLFEIGRRSVQTQGHDPLQPGSPAVMALGERARQVRR